MDNRQYYVYIMASKTHSVLYTGVTNDLRRRVWEHKHGVGSKFARRYNADRLVYYEAGGDVSGAIWREKQLKDGPRARKVRLIEGMNPDWRDLWPKIMGKED